MDTRQLILYMCDQEEKTSSLRSYTDIEKRVRNARSAEEAMQILADGEPQAYEGLGAIYNLFREHKPKIPELTIQHPLEVGDVPMFRRLAHHGFSGNDIDGMYKGLCQGKVEDMLVLMVALDNEMIDPSLLFNNPQKGGLDYKYPTDHKIIEDIQGPVTELLKATAHSGRVASWSDLRGL